MPYVPEDWTVACSVRTDGLTYRKYSAEVSSGGGSVARRSYRDPPVVEGTLREADRRRALEHATYAINYYRLLPRQFSDSALETITLRAGTGAIRVSRPAYNVEGGDAHAIYKIVRGGLTTPADARPFTPEPRTDKTGALRYSGRPLVPEPLPDWRLRLELTGDWDGLPAQVTLGESGHLFAGDAALGGCRDSPPRAVATLDGPASVAIAELASQTIERFALAAPRSEKPAAGSPRRGARVSLCTSSGNDEHGIEVEDADLAQNELFQRDVQLLIDAFRPHLTKDR